MNRSTVLSRLAWAGIAVAVTLSPLGASADDQDVRDYRSHIMKTMGEQVAMLGLIAQGKAPAADVATQAEVLHITAGMAKVAFTPKVLGGDSKPEIWDKWDDFSKRLDALVAATDELAKSAKQGGLAAATPKLRGLSCKGCHDDYRVPKK